MTTIALFGAGGKIGYRIAKKLYESDYRSLYLEISPEGISALAGMGVQVTPQDAALPQADIIILAVPDNLIARIAGECAPKMKSGAMIMSLDAAAAYAGQLPKRQDLSYFVVHPCHPPLFGDETDPEARRDAFGGDKARQNIVCSLLGGSETDYTLGEAVARVIFGPVMQAHRITIEQMALLEPAVSECIAATCLVMIHEAMTDAIKMGVPEQAARDFMLGHLHIALGIVFGTVDADFSDGCKVAIDRAKRTMFKPGWKDVLQPERLAAEIEAITSFDSVPVVMER
jgi:D-apionate oxidoisomerase